LTQCRRDIRKIGLSIAVRDSQTCLVLDSLSHSRERWVSRRWRISCNGECKSPANSCKGGTNRSLPSRLPSDTDLTVLSAPLFTMSQSADLERIDLPWQLVHRKTPTSSAAFERLRLRLIAENRAPIRPQTSSCRKRWRCGRCLR
jgi:hypothetical protein